MRIIAGTHKNRILVAPKSMETRPTAERLREALFNICQMYIENASFLDLFAGSGAMGLEALSRGAKEATLIDSSQEAAKCIKKNIETLNFGNRARVICGDVFTWMNKLEQMGVQFDIIYADPPYEVELYPHKVMEIVDQGKLLVPGGTLFIEEVHGRPLQVKWERLKLVNSRKMGKSSLHQFTL